MRSLINRLVGCGLLLLTGCGRTETPVSTAATPPATFTVFYTCDTRGHLEPCTCSAGPAGGVARRATYLAQQHVPGALLVDAGDVVSGPRDWELLEYDYLLLAYQQMGYHAINAGHREAALGLAKLQELHRRYPRLISANLLDKQGHPVLSPFTVVEVRPGWRVGILGVMDDQVAPSDIGDGLTIAPPEEAIARQLPELQRQADWIVLLGFADEARLQALAERFYEIPIVIGGKVLQASATPVRVNKSLVTVITDKGKTIGRLDLAFGKKGLTVMTNDIVTLTDQFPDDPTMAELIADFKRAQQSLGIQVPERRDDEEGLSLIQPAARKEQP